MVTAALDDDAASGNTGQGAKAAWDRADTVFCQPRL
jgi:hypothetical protein